MSNLLARLQHMRVEDRDRWLRSGLEASAKPARLEQYRALLTHPYFLAAKIEYQAVKTAGLLRDFERYLGLWPNDVEVQSLYRLISQSAALLDNSGTLTAIANSLLSRLSHRPEFRRLAQQWSRELRKPYLTAAHLLPDLSPPNLLYTFQGHLNQEHMAQDLNDPVKACVLSKDGEFIASVSGRRLYVWSRTGQEAAWERPRIMPIDETYLPTCALSADGAVVALALHQRLAGQQVEVWQRRQPNDPIWAMPLAQGWTIKRLLLSADGQTLVIAIEQSNLNAGEPTHGFIVQQLRTNHGYFFLGAGGWLFGCSLSADGAYLAAAALGNLYLWETATGQLRQICPHPGTRQSVCALSADGRMLVSAGGSLSSAGGKSVLEGSVDVDGKPDFSLCVWNVADGQLRRRLAGHQAHVNGCAISADNHLIVSAAADNSLNLWDAHSGQRLATLRDHRATHRGVSNIEACAISGDGTIVVSASSDRTVKVWDVSLYAAVHQADSAAIKRRTRADSTFNRLVAARHFAADCAMDAAGRFVVSVRNNHLLIWAVESGRKRFQLTGHDQSVNGCTLSADGALAVSAGSDKTVKVWRIDGAGSVRGFRKLEAVATFSGHQDGPLQPVQGVFQQFRPQGRPAYSGVVRRCAISPDKAWIVSASQDRSLILWDLQSGAIRHRLQGHTQGVSDCAISPDASLIVSASDDQTLKIWEAATGRELRTLIGHGGAVSACAMAPDGSSILSAGTDRTIRIWDVAGRQEPLVIEDAHLATVNDCVFNSTGAWILSCGEDGALKIWDRETKKQIAGLRVAGALRACAWSLAESQIVAAGADGLYFFALIR